MKGHSLIFELQGQPEVIFELSRSFEGQITQNLEKVDLKEKYTEDYKCTWEIFIDYEFVIPKYENEQLALKI